MSNEYVVDENGIIISLGKFEGEPSYVPFFWGMVLGGAYTTAITTVCDDTYYFILITEEYAERFELDWAGYYIVLTENDQGFVYSYIVSPEQMQTMEETYNKEWDEYEKGISRCN